MIRWEKYIHAFRDYLILWVLLSFSFFFIFKNENPQIRWMRSNVLNLIGMWQNGISAIFQYRTLKIENEILRTRLASLSYENSLMEEAYLENDRLRRLLEFKQKSKYDLIPVSIISRNYEGFSHTFVINAGTADSVKDNMPVVSSEGLVGRIFEAGKNTSLVQILDDINFRVSAMIQRTRITGIVRPDENMDLLIDFVPLRLDVKKGDVVVTSGFSDTFPKGIEIGIIFEIKTQAAEQFKTLFIKPSSDLLRLEEAFVIKNPPNGIQ